MEIRIGIINTGRELSFESDSSADEITTAVGNAIKQGETHLTFTDSKGKSYIVPTINLAYVEVGTDQTRRVGFA